MKKWMFAIAFLISSSICFGQALPAPLNLRTDLLLHTGSVSKGGLPVNISLQKAAANPDNYQFAIIKKPHPTLSWQLANGAKKATACRIMVASSPEKLAAGKADAWETKKLSANGTQMRYNGKPLESGKVYYWKVQYWDENNQPSAFSAPASFYYEPDVAEPFSHHPLAAQMEQPTSISRAADGSYFLDFGKAGFSQLQLRLTSNKADSIWIEAAEAVAAPGQLLKVPGNIRYIKLGLYVQQGTHDYTLTWPVNEKRNSRNPVQMPGYIGEVYPFRYVVVSNFSGTIKPGDVRRKTVFYPFNDNAAHFESSDSILNKVWELCKYSIKATSFTGYYIDGDRERLPYEADALINQLSHYAVDAEYSIARRSMAYVIFHPTWPTEWSLQNVPLAWNDYLYTGDTTFISRYYGELQKKILMPLAAENGLISTRTGKQTDAFLESIHMVKDFDGKHGLKDNVDWPQTGNYIGNEKQYGGETDGFVYTDYNSVINAWYYQSLVLMHKIARVLGRQADADFYKKSAAQVYQSFQKAFVNTSTRLVKDGDTTEHSSLHANMFALAFGLVPRENMRPVINFIKTRKMACSVYGAQFLLDALYDANEDDYALELMTATTQRSWYNMLRVGSTITLEAWDKVYKPNLDWNHAWGSAPANIIVRRLMGVEPLSPGADTIRIRPQTGQLAHAKLTTQTIKGKVSVLVKKSAAADQLEIDIPGATVAMVELPSNSAPRKLLVNGKQLTLQPVNGFYRLPPLGAGRHTISLH